MLPSKFPEHNKVLGAPVGMTNCEPLQVYTDGDMCLSQWKMSWKERFHVLFTGKIWLWVFFGATQPPVAMQVESPFRKRK